MGDKIVIAEPVPHNRVTAEDVQLFENFSQEALQNLDMLCTEGFAEPHAAQNEQDDPHSGVFWSGCLGEPIEGSFRPSAVLRSSVDVEEQNRNSAQESRLTNDAVFLREIDNILNSQLVVIRQNNNTKFEICAVACIIIIVVFLLVFGLYIHR